MQVALGANNALPAHRSGGSLVAERAAANGLGTSVGTSDGQMGHRKRQSCKRTHGTKLGLKERDCPTRAGLMIWARGSEGNAAGIRGSVFAESRYSEIFG